MTAFEKVQKDIVSVYLNVDGNIAFVLAGLHKNGQSPVPGSGNDSKGVDRTDRIEQHGVVARQECEDSVAML